MNEGSMGIILELIEEETQGKSASRIIGEDHDFEREGINRVVLPFSPNSPTSPAPPSLPTFSSHPTHPTINPSS